MLPATTTTKYPFWPKSSTDYLLFLFQIHLSVSCFPGHILDFMLNFHSSEAHINPFPALSTSHDITGSLAKCFLSAYRLLYIFLLQELSCSKHQSSTSAQLNLFLKLFLEWNCRQKCTAVAMKGLIFREFHRIYSVRCSWAVSLSPWKSSARAVRGRDRFPAPRQWAPPKNCPLSNPLCLHAQGVLQRVVHCLHCISLQYGHRCQSRCCPEQSSCPASSHAHAR